MQAQLEFAAKLVAIVPAPSVYYGYNRKTVEYPAICPVFWRDSGKKGFSASALSGSHRAGGTKIRHNLD